MNEIDPYSKEYKNNHKEYEEFRKAKLKPIDVKRLIQEATDLEVSKEAIIEYVLKIENAITDNIREITRRVNDSSRKRITEEDIITFFSMTTSRV